MREARGRLAFVCPIGGIKHGQLTTVDGGFYCPHQSHDGSPSRSRNGLMPATQKFFTYEDLTKKESSNDPDH